jgi:ATP synthase protein I
MDEIWKRAIRVTLLFSACCLLIWAVVPEWRTVMAGLLLGAAASMMNALLLRKRVEWIGKAAAEKMPRRAGAGLAGRLATVLLAAMIAHRYPEHFHLPTTLLACFFMPFAALACAYFLNKRQF